MLDNIHTAVLVFNERLELSGINTAGEALLSLSRRRACGRHAEALLSRCGALVDTMRSAVATGRPYREWEMALHLDSGGAGGGAGDSDNSAAGAARELLVDCIVTPLSAANGRRQVIVELIDVGAYSRALREKNLTALHEAARKSLAGMAHEIKNPLGAVRGAAQLLRDELPREELREYTDLIVSETDRLRGLVDRMLAPAPQAAARPVNIHEVIEYVCGVIVAESEPRPQIERDYDPSLPLLRADREQLVQVLMNLMLNARQAIGARQAAGEGGRIWVQTRIRRRYTLRRRVWKLVVVIQIMDDGPGVPEEIVEQIFYPLVTGRAEGAGLGLSIAQSLIHAHHGLIEYERNGDKSCFRILLPATDDREPGQAA